LRSHDEVRDASEVFDHAMPKPEARMLEIAEKIIEQQQADFDPSEFKDRYEDALRELIARKKKGEPVVSAAPEQKEEKVVDLMEALRRSLKGDGGSREKAERFLAAQEKKKGKRKSAARKRAA
jgi:DNA end-binding protein Ku